MRLLHIGLILGLCAVSACDRTGLRELDRPGEGPDEFLITPGKPLQEPTDYAALPEPTPGGVNLTDQLPLEESVALLGGRRSGAGGPIPGADGAVVNHASRFGRDGAIRETLAVEDEAFRKRRGRFTQIRLGRRDRYNLVYNREKLDAQAEFVKWRRAGARTPSAPE